MIKLKAVDLIDTRYKVKYGLSKVHRLKTNINLYLKPLSLFDFFRANI